jgi:hypothetical protein
VKVKSETLEDDLTQRRNGRNEKAEKSNQRLVDLDLRSDRRVSVGADLVSARDYSERA